MGQMGQTETSSIPLECCFVSFVRFLIFTVLYWCPLHSGVNQPWLHIHPLRLEPHPLPYLTPLGHHRGPDWAPCVTRFMHDSVRMLVLLSPLVPLSPSPTVRVVNPHSLGNNFDN